MAVLVGAAVGTGGCGCPSRLAGPPPGFSDKLAQLLRSAPLDPPGEGTPVLTLVHRLPESGDSSGSLSLALLPGRAFPAKPVGAALTGAEVLADPGRYVAVVSLTSRKSHYIVRIADPGAIRSESFDPSAHAELFRAEGGAYSVRIPFLPLTTVVGFKIDDTQRVERVEFFLPLEAEPPRPRWTRFGTESHRP